LSKLDARQTKHEEDVAKFKTETISALSVVVKSVKANKDAIEANKADADKKIEANATNINKNAAAIVNLAKELGLVLQKVNKNTEAIDKTNKVASDTKASVEASAKQTTATFVVNEAQAKTDADALKHAVNSGIAPADIKLIKKNDKGQYVVTYVTHKAPAKADTKVDTKPVAKQDTKPVQKAVVSLSTVVLYTVKTQEAAYAQLQRMGYNKDKVKSLTRNEKGQWTAQVQD
jgi:hypothetical protein